MSIKKAQQLTKPGIDWWDTIKGVSIGVLVLATVVIVAYGVSVVLTSGVTTFAEPGYDLAMGLLLTGGTAATISVSTAKDQTVY
jgi:uncharacterized membrane protein YcfT